MEKTLNIVHLFPDLLNLYGDKGNILVLKKRCTMRGIGVNVISYTKDEEPDFKDADIIYLGGGGDKEQDIVLKKLEKYKEELKTYRDSDGVLLAACGGFPLLGSHYAKDGNSIECLGLCDFYTEEKKERLIGNVCVDTPFGVIVGFENHSERVHLGENSIPLGKIIRGSGNNGKDKTEGVVYKNIYGTFLHGPLLPKNPEFADVLIRKAIIRKYNDDLMLAPLDDELGKKAKAYILTLKKEEL